MPDELQTQIRNAFETVPRPAWEAITGCTCSECTEIRDDFNGVLSNDREGRKMDYHCWDMGFMTDEARHYFLPAWLHLAIKEPKSGYADALLEAFGQDAGWEPPGGYSPAQKEAIAAFLRHLKATDAIHDWPEYYAALFRWTGGLED